MAFGHSFKTVYNLALLALCILGGNDLVFAQDAPAVGARDRVSLNAGWRFQRWINKPDSVSYSSMKAWIMPATNDLIKEAAKRARRPSNEPANVTFA